MSSDKEIEKLKARIAELEGTKTPIYDWMESIGEWFSDVWYSIGEYILILILLFSFFGFLVFIISRADERPISPTKCNTIAEIVDENAKWVNGLDSCIAKDGDKLIYYTIENNEIKKSVKPAP